MTEPDADSPPLQRAVRRALVAVCVGIVVSGVGLALSLIRPDNVGPSLAELGWNRQHTRREPPAPLDSRPRVAVRFSDDERFGLVALGDPDKPIPLTQDPAGRTNNTCVRIDGYDYLFGKESQKIARWRFKGSTSAGRDHSWGHHSCMEFPQSGVQVTQSAEIVVGEHTRLYDTLLVRYRLANRGPQARTVGLRVMLDVGIGDNHAVPFYVPPSPGEGAEKVGLSPVQFLQANNKVLETTREVPDYIIALESAEIRDLPPVAVALGLDEAGSEPPAGVVVCQWPGNSEIGWDWNFERIGGAGKGDSCVVLYWPNRTLEPGEDRIVAFSYGLSVPPAAARRGDRLHVYADPPRVAPGAPFRVVACVQTRFLGQKAILTLPPGVTAAEGCVLSFEQTVPPPGKEGYARVIWHVQANHAGAFPLVVKAPDIGTARTWVQVGD